MDVTPLIRSDQKVIQSYKSGVFKINGEVYDRPVCVTPSNVSSWDVESFDSLSIEHFDFIIKQADEIDVVLLGTGKNIAFLPQALSDELRGAGISVDSMDTGAACRTYNVLMAEGRRVVCLLFPNI